MHGLDSGDDDSSGQEGLETQHRSRNPFDGTVILFDDVVEIFILAHQDVNTGVSLDTFNDGRVGATLVDGDLLWHVVQVDGALQKAPSCSQVALGSEQSYLL